VKLKKSWLYPSLILALPLLLSHCGQQQTSAARPDPYNQGLENRPIKLSPDQELLPPDRLQAMGEMALQSGDYDSSLINFLEILRREPERYDLHYKVGVIFLLKGQLEPAQTELALVLVHRPEMSQAHEALGMVHLQQKKYSQALAEFQQVLNQDASQVNARHLLGVTYLEDGQPAKAVTELQRVLVLDRRHLASYVALGQAYTELKDYRRAIKCLRQGLGLDPTNKKLNYQLGQALAGEKLYDQALEAFMKAGDEAQAYNNIGVHYFMAGQYEEAAKCFQRAIELRPTFYGEAKSNLQKALEKLHQVQKNDG